MTDQQWNTLLAVLDGQAVEPLPVGFIIDSPWLPNWAGMSILDYYASERLWLQANLAAIRRFPDVLFLPGFWSEYGMCTEPSAFGARPVWAEDEFPFAEKVVADVAQIADLPSPNPARDGLLPFVLKRLEHCQEAIEAESHAIRFAVARGPLNVASFLMGNTEFLTALMTHPEETHRLLEVVTDFLCEWIALQKKAFPTIEGVLVLDDILGFLGEAQFVEFALPCVKRVFASAAVAVRLLHNDSRGEITARHCAEMGINLFNFAFEHSLPQMKEWTGGEVALLGNIPPRDVLASGTPDDVRRAVRQTLDSVDDPSRLILSCGGGMPPGVPTENIEAFCDEARNL
ncbi:MAG: uroporphyrinogen decarboxylase family protein [Planctomycetota bacterium]